MFSQKEFIEASRDFVCVRLESYESKEHQDMVRTYLNGRFENTAFVILAPDGKTRLSGTGRSPAMGFGLGRPRGGDGDSQHQRILLAMQKISSKYPAKNIQGSPVLQDFHSFRQALNVASGDQRLLVYTAAPERDREELRKTLAPVLGHPDLVGTFHIDFGSQKEDSEWFKAVDGEKGRSGIFVIRADAYGQKGTVMAQLELDADPEKLKSALAKANEEFAGSEKRKVYRDHVRQGRREGVYFKGGMPYGEDRDADGKIDHRGGSRQGADERRGARRGKGGPPPRERGGPSFDRAR